MNETSDKPSTPELDRLNALHRSGEWNAVLAFAESPRFVVAQWEPVEHGPLSQSRTKQLQATRLSPEGVAERHFGLDGAKLDAERDALLRWASS